MKPYYEEELAAVYHGDCIDVIRELPDGSVDAVVTDPPYGIRFMGESWDGADIVKRQERGKATSPMPAGIGGPNGGYRSIAAEAGRYNRSLKASLAFMDWSKEWASECYRLLKPGGHMLAFGSPRCYHQLGMGIELAGFEIRDTIAWLFGQGFPKPSARKNARLSGRGLAGEPHSSLLSSRAWSPASPSQARSRTTYSRTGPARSTSTLHA